MDDYGSTQMGFLFASVGNTIPATFWSLYYILRDSAAPKTIHNEIENHLPNFSLLFNKENDRFADDSINETLLRCVNLDSAVNKTL